MTAFIPSPASNGFHVGPLFFHAYGIAYVFAVLAAILVTRRRWEKQLESGVAPSGDAGRGARGKPGGSRELVYEVAAVGFPAGVIGGRIYFLITTPSQVPPHWWGAFAIWKGGLGIWGGIAGGVLAGLWWLRRRGIDIPKFMDAAAPGLLVAQSIGRIGNYFNKELFGGPTTLPWGLKIPYAYRPPGYTQYATFQPTFLYEIIWNLALAALLVWLGRRYRDRLKAPGLFALYVAGYSGFRIFEETLRIDYSHHILGLRLNFFVATILCIAGLVWFVAIQRGWSLRLGRRARRGAGIVGLAWVVAWAAGCGSAGRTAQAAMRPATAQAASRLRERIPASTDQGLVFATSSAVSQARRAVATP
jgi:prolipoprotein diacylglyceryl transferase